MSESSLLAGGVQVTDAINEYVQQKVGNALEPFEEALRVREVCALETLTFSQRRAGGQQSPALTQLCHSPLNLFLPSVLWLTVFLVINFSTLAPKLVMDNTSYWYLSL